MNVFLYWYIVPNLNSTSLPKKVANMAELSIGDLAPDFTLPTDGAEEITLSQLQGQKIVLYFYPKDDTPGCTQESKDFRDSAQYFSNANTCIIGISKDSAAKHDKFKAKYNLNFPLASDEDTKVCQLYGVWIEKSMYGKKYMGINRSTFIIDETGKIAAIWSKVKVTGHINEVKETLSKLSKAA